jgi:hypothetical protein
MSLSVAFSVCRGEYDVMRNSRVLIGKPAVGHATNERVPLIGNPIRGSHHGHAAKATATTGRIHDRIRPFVETSDSSCTAGAVHTRPTPEVRCAMCASFTPADPPTALG